MITNFKLFESEDNFEIIGTNEAYWSWEDDSQRKIAELIIDKNDDSLYLKIHQTWTNHGIGAGTRTSILVYDKIGDLKKANLVKVRELLKKNTIAKSSGGYGFSIHWYDNERNKMSLSELIKNYKEEHQKPELKYIKPISVTKKDKIDKTINSSDIEIVKYSEKSYALFGLDTKKIKDELISLGCRYNRFLTDPNTGTKRAGWIFTENKLDKIKKLVNEFF